MTTTLITGAGRGIGLELARQSLAKGWNVIGSVRRAEAAAQLAKELPEVKVLQFDVSDHDAITAAAGSIDSPIDILINNAGIYGPDEGAISTKDFDGFAETLAVNTIAPLRIAQAFLPHLKRGTNARLINISSNMGRMVHDFSNRIAYRTSKAALNKVVQALASDLKPEGICAIAMHPGWVRTDMGTSSADISVEESASGILDVVSKLTLADTCQFIDWDGTKQPW